MTRTVTDYSHLKEAFLNYICDLPRSKKWTYSPYFLEEMATYVIFCVCHMWGWGGEHACACMGLSSLLSHSISWSNVSHWNLGYILVSVPTQFAPGIVSVPPVCWDYKWGIHHSAASIFTQWITPSNASFQKAFTLPHFLVSFLNILFYWIITVKKQGIELWFPRCFSLATSTITEECLLT